MPKASRMRGYGGMWYVKGMINVGIWRFSAEWRSHPALRVGGTQSVLACLARGGTPSGEEGVGREG